VSYFPETYLSDIPPGTCELDLKSKLKSKFTSFPENYLICLIFFPETTNLNFPEGVLSSGNLSNIPPGIVIY